ncbi:MAG: quinone-dependent dihydroorotate dehydrogenase [Nocardioidaceae bacterium]
MTLYHRLFDALMSNLDAERAHQLGFAALRSGTRLPGVVPLLRSVGRSAPAGQVRALGLTFPGPLGIAAGFDKNAVGVDALAAVGFSFVEVGTVTAHPQAGNERPRMFRLVADRAVVNRMGFNNDGAAVVAARLAARLAARRGKRRRNVIVGVNIGRSRSVAESDATDDYALSARLLAPFADYLVVNVSSPNTPGLRDLQAVDRLEPLLVAVREHADRSAERHVPLLVKISPDLADDEITDLAALAVDLRLDGIVAVNTTTARQGLRSPRAAVEAAGAGGLSGPPLAHRSLEVLRLLRGLTGTMALISVGGVTTATDIADRLAAGATLVQAYTAFVYEGPGWPARVQAEVAR